MTSKKPLVLLLTLLLAILAAAPSAAVVCGDTITTHTVLTADLLHCPSFGLAIGANGVTLDLNGHTISGSGIATGVVVGTSLKNVRIVGPGTIQKFHLGVAAHGSERITVEGLSFANNPGSAVAFYDTGVSTVRANKMVDNGDAVSIQSYAAPHTFNRVLDNQIQGGSRRSGGISVDSNTDVEIARNVIFDTGWAISLFGTERVVVEGNVLAANDLGVAIISYVFGPTDENVVVENQIFDATYGIWVGTSGGPNAVTRTTLKGNLFQGGVHGISLVDPAVLDTAVSENQLWGVTNPIADAATGTLLSNNMCDGLPC